MPTLASGVRHVRDVAVPTSAGLLRADLFLPDLLTAPVGVVLEYLPYRKDDRSRRRWDVHVELARAGLAGCRLDVPGTGYSGGRVDDEYSETEIRAGLEAIEWLAAQSWSSGRVGMFGSSYGGFNTLAIAMRRPRALKAIAPHAASDDRYGADAHYWGGALLPVDTAQYGSLMLALNAAPPLRFDRPDWRELWSERLDGRPWLFEWLRHQREDGYWRRASLSSDFAAIDCPVLWLGGWHDAYTGGLLRSLRRLVAPARGIVGPWLHARPDEGLVLGPQADYLEELLPFFHAHLSGHGEGGGPALRYYLMHGREPGRVPRLVEGEWRALELLPERQDGLVLHLGSATLERTPARAGARRWRFDAAVGTTGGAWCPGAGPVGVALDQAEDNARSLCYDGEPLGETLELFGSPRLRLVVSATTSVAFVSAKLCLLGRDGSSLLLCRGFLNLTRRAGLDRADPLVPGESGEIELELSPVAFLLPRGARLRLALAGADFPTTWPAPAPFDLEVRHSARAVLSLPLLAPGQSSPDPGFALPRAKAQTAEARDEREQHRARIDESRGIATVCFGERGAILPRPVEEFRHAATFDTRIAASLARPGRTRMTAGRRLVFEEGDAVTETDASFRLSSDERELRLETVARIAENGRVVEERRFAETFPRDLL